ncbi:MAG: hypothetical protein ACOC7J_00340 [Armatimonadota bacterium]
MRERRQGRTILIVIALIVAVATLVFLGQIFAQDDLEEDPGAGPPPGMEGMEDEMDMGMGMGGPGMGMRPDGAPLAWTEQEMPEELTMTYDEFLARTGQQRALIPDNFLTDDEGNPRRNTRAQWMQLQRIYATREAIAEVGVAGKPGYGLATRIQREIAVKEGEIADVRYLYEKGLNNFSFEIGYPQVEHSAITPGARTVPISVGVIMKVQSGVAQRYPSLVYRKLKKYDFYGEDRQRFRIVDYEGGIWNPKEIYLYNGAVSEWNGLWGQNSITLTLYDVAGDRIVSGTQPAGHTGGICARLVHPHELNYAPMHETIIAPRDKAFEGGNLNLSGKKGWYYNFSFTVPLSELAGLDRAEAVLIGAGGIEGSMGQTQAPPPEEIDRMGGASRAAVRSGVEQATGTARRGVGMSGYSLGPPAFTPGFQ